VAVVLVALSEAAGNAAAAVTFLPVIASLAVGMGQGPVLLATVATLAASGGFILPVASPPDAIVNGTGRVTLPQMVRGGIVMDAVFALVLPLLAYLLPSGASAPTGIPPITARPPVRRRPTPFRRARVPDRRPRGGATPRPRPAA
jgi:sodium-dependent dicarboxylate transporter 2/3/5